MLFKLGADDLRFRSLRGADIAGDDLRNCCWFVIRMVTNGDRVAVGRLFGSLLGFKTITTGDQLIGGRDLRCQ